MTGKEYFWGYLQLVMHGYSSNEAKEILEEIEEKMKRDEKMIAYC